MATIDDVEAKMISFAKELGITKGKLEALDERVKHNCEANERNFTTLQTSINNLSVNVVKALAEGETRDKLVQDQVAKLTAQNHELDKGVLARRVIIFFSILVGIIVFVGGGLISWRKIDQFYEKTTAQQRAEMVKQGIEAGIETATKLK